MQENIITLLKDNHFDNYLSLFEDNNLNNLEILGELTENDLEKLGINKMGDRKQLIKLFLNERIKNISENIIEDSNDFLSYEIHGFTKFWIIMGIIVMVTRVIFNIFLEKIYVASPYDSVLEQFIELLPYYHNYEIYRLQGIFYIFGLIGYILLWRWKQLGFWLLCCVYIAVLIITIYLEADFFSIILSLSSIPILWGILHLRKNEKTMWTQLKKPNFKHFFN